MRRQIHPQTIKKHFVSLIVPAYRQETSILRNLRSLIKVLNNIRYDYEVIVVIDGLVDWTIDKIRTARLAKVTCLAYPENHGKAFALRLGMGRARGDYIMFIDSGMEIDPNSISMLLEHMEWYNADVIVGSKRHPASQVRYTWLRQILSYGYYYLVKVLFGVKVSDTQAGIKIFKRSVLQKVLPRVIEKRFAGDLEMLVVAYRLGYRKIFDAPIRLDFKLSEITSAATLRSIFGIFVDTIAIYYRAHFLRYYDKAHNRLLKPHGLKVIKLKAPKKPVRHKSRRVSQKITRLKLSATKMRETHGKTKSAVK